MSDDEKIQAIQNRERLLQRLREVVGAYGADRSRWPAADRHALRLLLATDGDALRLVSQARLLDRLLDFADRTAPAPAPAHLSARIMAKLASEHRDRADRDAHKRPAVGEVVVFPGRQRLASSPARKPSDAGGGKGWAASRWAPRAALAASLTIGIFFGAAGYLEEAAQSVTALAGLDVGFEASAAIDHGFAAMEEDFL